jgi:hypothetical protein
VLFCLPFPWKRAAWSQLPWVFHRISPHCDGRTSLSKDSDLWDNWLSGWPLHPLRVPCRWQDSLFQLIFTERH